jgi:hypothetical protein
MPPASPHWMTPDAPWPTGPHTVVGLLVDRNPVSESIVARAHGRVDMLLCSCKALLALAGALTAAGTARPALLIIASCIVAVLQLYAYVVYQPLYSARWNQYHGSFALVFAWAAACTLLAQLRHKPDNEVGHHDGRLSICARGGLRTAQAVCVLGPLPVCAAPP